MNEQLMQKIKIKSYTYFNIIIRRTEATQKMLKLTSLLFFISSVGPVETFPREMVSRRKILSRSRDDLNLDQAYLHQQQEEEEDVWYQKDKLFKVSAETEELSRVLNEHRMKWEEVIV